MRQWVAGGQEIGAHTQNHVNLLEVSDAEGSFEIVQGKTDLEHAIGQPVNHFCYPYGRYEARHQAMVQGSGFVTATTTQSPCLTMSVGPGYCMALPASA